MREHHFNIKLKKYKENINEKIYSIFSQILENKTK